MTEAIPACQYLNVAQSFENCIYLLYTGSEIPASVLVAWSACGEGRGNGGSHKCCACQWRGQSRRTPSAPPAAMNSFCSSTTKHRHAARLLMTAAKCVGPPGGAASAASADAKPAAVSSRCCDSGGAGGGVTPCHLRSRPSAVAASSVRLSDSHVSWCSPAGARGQPRHRGEGACVKERHHHLRPAAGQRHCQGERLEHRLQTAV